MSENKRIRIFIVDDHHLIIEGLRATLTAQDDMEVTGHAVSGRSCMDFFATQTADIVLMDINLPDMSGIDLCPKVLKIRPELKILALSTFNQRSYINEMMKNGARGYLLKNTGIQEIQEAIRQVHKGNIFICREAGDTLYSAGASGQQETLPPLTPREKEILKLVVDGLTAPEIAEKIFVSQLTVETHRRNIMAKLKAKNVAMLIKIAGENQLL